MKKTGLFLAKNGLFLKQKNAGKGKKLPSAIRELPKEIC
jgi:hypothetical protein